MSNYLIIGDDAFIREKEISRLKEKFLSKDEVDLNFSTYFPHNIDEIINSVETMPFMAEKRIVLVKESQNFPDSGVDALTAYLEKPAKQAILILAADSSFKKSKIFKGISKHFEIIEANKPGNVDLRKWIKMFFNKEKISITDRAVDLILNFKGDDTQGIRMELEKLACFSSDGKIDVADIEAIVNKGVKENVFKLVDAVNSKNSEWVFKILNDLYDLKKQPQEIIGYMSWYFKIIQKILLLSGRSLGAQSIASELGYSPGYTKRLCEQAKKYSKEKVKRWTIAIFRTDNDIKTGRCQGRLALEMLFVEFLK